MLQIRGFKLKKHASQSSSKCKLIELCVAALQNRFLASLIKNNLLLGTS